MTGNAPIRVPDERLKDGLVLSVFICTGAPSPAEFNLERLWPFGDP